MSIIIAMSNVGAKLINADQNAVAIVSDTLSYEVEEFGRGGKRYNSKHTFLKFPDMIFEAGFVQMVKRALQDRGYPVSIHDTREQVQIQANDIDLIGIELRDYQLGGIEEIIKHKRGVLQMATGAGKCLGKDTPVMMYDGTIKPVQNVAIGDLLMGPDSKPRTVLSTCSGESKLYKVTPIKGDAYVVNDKHILSLKQTAAGNGANGKPRKGYEANKVINIEVEDYLAQNKTFKHIHKGWRTGVEFDEKKLPLDPYFLGLWLGDGRASGSKPSCEITTEDKEISDYLHGIAEWNDLDVREEDGNAGNANVYRLVRPGGGNPIVKELKRLELYKGMKGKHIPHAFKTASRKDRMKLLAGLLDSDGNYDGKTVNFIFKDEVLLDDIIYLARSLGFAAYKSEREKVCTNGGPLRNERIKGTYYATQISGEGVEEIPVLLERKKPAPRKQKKDVLKTGITVEDAGFGEYFGFQIDGDRLFLLGDFTVTHNTETAIGLTKYLGIKTLFLTHKLDLVRQTRKRYAARLGRPVGMISEGQWLPSDITVATVQTIMAHWRVRWKVIGLDKKGKPKKGSVYGDTETKAMKAAIGSGWREVHSIVVDRDERAKVTNFLNSVQCLIVDEAHRSSGDSFFSIISACNNAYYRASITATPMMKGNRGDDLKLIACSGDIIYRITNKDLIDRGILAKPYFQYVEVPGFVMPDGKMVSKRTPYPKAYKAGIVENDLRNKMVVDETIELVQRGRQTVVLVKEVAHGKKLQEMFEKRGVKSRWVYGNNKADDREDALRALREREINVLVASTILDEGLDEDSISAIVLAGGGKSQISLFQRVGRAMRARKGIDLERFGNTCEVVDFIDTGDRRLMQHSAKRWDFVKKEEGWEIMGYRQWQNAA